MIQDGSVVPQFSTALLILLSFGQVLYAVKKDEAWDEVTQILFEKSLGFFESKIFERKNDVNEFWFSCDNNVTGTIQN